MLFNDFEYNNVKFNCPCVCTFSICLFVHETYCLSVHQSNITFVHLSICLPFFVFCLYIFVPLYPSVHLSICPSVHLSICQSVSLFICLIILFTLAQPKESRQIHLSSLLMAFLLPTLCQCKYSLNDLLYLQSQPIYRLSTQYIGISQLQMTIVIVEASISIIADFAFFGSKLIECERNFTLQENFIILFPVPFRYPPFTNVTIA